MEIDLVRIRCVSPLTFFYNAFDKSITIMLTVKSILVSVKMPNIGLGLGVFGFVALALAAIVAVVYESYTDQPPHGCGSRSGGSHYEPPPSTNYPTAYDTPLPRKKKKKGLVLCAAEVTVCTSAQSILISILPIGPILRMIFV